MPKRSTSPSSAAPPTRFDGAPAAAREAERHEPETAPSADRYDDVRRRTTELCAPLSAEDAVVQSMPDASPAKWHLAHTTWFFETFVLAAALPGYEPLHPDYGFLFNSYYNAVGPMHDRPLRGMLTRPALADVLAYRRAVDDGVAELLERGCEPRIGERILLGLHHEQQHQELILTDVKHVFSCNPLLPAYHGRRPPPATAAPPLGWASFGAGVREIGRGADGFAFDNERPRHRFYVHAFELASRPVTNGEYAAFIEDGGYERPELWLSDGWAFVRAQSIAAPLYWTKRDGAWLRFSLAGSHPLDLDAPVSHVSFYEAWAFARWAGARLPTEHEWETAACGVAVTGNFADDGWFEPRACAPATGSSGAEPADERGEAPLAQLFGDVWEWTASAYLPYPGYREPEGALGEYNGKFMSGQMVLRGGSCATPRSHVRATYRNFFPPHARWQFAGLRLARDAS